MDEKQRLRYMKRALHLADKGAGWVAPNPKVGAVIVKQGQIIGRGYHRRFGAPHAEVEAIAHCRKQREDPRGAVMFVSLEPCCHQGKTGPCTEAIAAAGIAHVEIATLDECPLVAGKGAAWLKKNGITVNVGCCERHARRLNAGFFKLQKEGLPQVILKWAQSLDAKLAWPNNAPQRLITNEKSRRHLHQLRSRCGAVLVGVGTVLADDPLLTARLNRKSFQPLRVVLDSRLRIPLESQLVQTAKISPLLIYTLDQIDALKKRKAQSLQNLGCEVITVGADNGCVDLKKVLENLGRRGVTDVLVEGGAQVLKAFWQKNLADKLMAYIAPVIVGSAPEIPALDFAQPSQHTQNVSVRHFEGDTLIEVFLRE